MIYCIRERDIDKFASLSKDSANYKKTVKSLWDDGLSFPEWCFLFEEEGKTVGRIGYWASLDNPMELHIFGLVLPWNDDNCQLIGQKLISESIEKMKKQGVKTVNYQLHSDEGKAFILTKQIVELIGMEEIQAKKRFVLTKNSFQHKDNNRLLYKSLKEVGQSLFIETIEKVTTKTLDRRLFGGKEAAKNHFHDLKSLDFSVENWFIAYLRDQIIGLIIPQKLTDDIGAINYIGVIPDERGQGYVIDLLDQGIKNLFRRSMEKIIADIDELNYPMEQALLKVGFQKEEKKLLNYRLIIDN